MSATLEPVGVDAPSTDAAPQSPRRAAWGGALARRRLWIVSGIAVLAIALGVGVILAPPASVSTDDAYLEADGSTVAPKVRGLVAAILVRDNQAVRAGDPLVRIDPEEFDAKVATARADLAEAQAGVAAAGAALVSLNAEERLAAANVIAARTAIRASEAQAERADADSRRYAALVASGAVARKDADGFRAGAVTAEQDAAHAGALLAVARDALGVTSARRPSLDAALQKAHAEVQRDRSALDLALQDQRHTVVRAPIDGVVGNRQVQQGDYVQPGSRLLTVVPLDALYVTANFKETQTARMRPGQHATVRVDAGPSARLSGVVDSLAPGSGSSFALLPFEPGTGNFTKIVQRVPVRIRLNGPAAERRGLRPGLSVTADVTLDP